ncbi:DUF1932 domain-containing protein [Candidatus Bipolaricaulota bacterium]
MIHQTIGVLHPGNMGVSVAASIKAAGNEVIWASDGRSDATRERASKAGLKDVTTLASLCGACSIIVSVCPPHAAETVSQQVLGHGFTGLYLDANAISPQTAVAIGEKVATAGGSFVDGGIIGGPAWESGHTWLYLSGAAADESAAILKGGPLEIAAIGSDPGNASALKMCYAAYTKGTSALLSAIMAAATHYGVRADLERQWSREGSDFADKTTARVRRVTSKAWRFIGEMEEIAATFRAAGLPDGFHEAAADVYRRMAGLEELPDTPSLEHVLSRLLDS